MSGLYMIFVTFFAGMGAGLGTGFAGMSAAAVISPMLITFLGMDPYMAVGIALSSDVLASAVSAYTYHKNKNLDDGGRSRVHSRGQLYRKPASVCDNGIVFGIHDLPARCQIYRPPGYDNQGGYAAGFAAQTDDPVVGLRCDDRFHLRIGAGGGMMMLLILTSVLGYELKTAVGTSVFIMTFTAVTGAASHFMIGGMPDWRVCLLCVVFTLLWARIAAVFANRAQPKTLNRATGIVLVMLGAAIMMFKLIA